MKTPFRIVKRIALVAVLAGSATGLAISSGGTPGSHAAGIVYPCALCISSPTISASSPAASTITVSGRNFTQGGTVQVLVTSPQGSHESTWVTTATFTRCNLFTGLCTLGGGIALTGYTQGCDGNGYFTLQAYDYSSHTYSNRVSVWVYAGQCIP
jgi:hypothetical protein